MIVKLFFGPSDINNSNCFN